MREKRKIGKKIFALAASAALTVAMAIPSFAAGITYTGVAGGTVNIQKYLIMDENTQVPNKEFQYGIEAGAAVASDGTDAKLEVYAGNDANKVTGTPSIGVATFSNNSATFTTPQVIGQAPPQIDPAHNTDPVTLATGQKYAKAPVEVDFSGVTFKEPGIYRYIVTEYASNDSSITDDQDDTRTMDVYVIDDNGALAVEGYVLHNDETVVSRDGSTLTADNKAYGYVNTYNTNSLVISQAVTGNQASRDEYFEFTVTINGAGAGNVLGVVLDNCDATTIPNPINPTAMTNPATITADQSGTATATFWLQNGQYVTIRDIGKGAQYSVVQNKTTMQSEGYSIPEGGITNTDTQATTSLANFSTSGSVVNDVEIGFTDTRAGVLPTGVFVTAGTGIAILAVAGVLIALLVVKRKKASKNN